MIVGSDDFGQRCVLLFTDIDIQRCFCFLTQVLVPAALGIALLIKKVIIGISHFGIVIYKLKVALELLYFVVSDGRFRFVCVD